VKDLCKIFNVKLAKEEMERLFSLANQDRGDRNNKDKGQVRLKGHKGQVRTKGQKGQCTGGITR
jgi:hypothetical protein